MAATTNRICPIIILLLFFLPADSRAQTPQSSASDVVLLSLELANSNANVQQHIRQDLLGPTVPDNPLLETQMNIVRATAKFGPVLLLAPDESTKTALEQNCQQFDICELLKSDRVRIRVVVHDGVWIRDFGPSIEAAADSAHVIHWRYFDLRAEEAKREKFQELETARLKLLETRQQQDQPDALTLGATPDSHKAALSTIDDKLYLLKEYSQILSEASLQRTNDDNSAYDIADAVLAAPDFRYTASALALDGGNLFKLDDGRCLTTRVLLSRNKDKDQDINVDQELEKVAGCKTVTYLDPLPGNVIEHIDMFALPAGGKRILLASYDLASPFAAQYWSKLDDVERDLALNASLAMQRNAQLLKGLGYEVVPVPSPFPRVPGNGHTFYPAVLNVLVRESTDGRRQILAPSYKDYETDIQSAAVRQIEAAFGPKTEMVTIEATEAAKAQGAIHCLTLNVPLQLSIFGDSADNARRTAALAQKDQLDKAAAAEVASHIPPTGLHGSWAIVDKDDDSDETPSEQNPQRIFFTANEFQKGVLDHLQSQGKYTVESRDQTTWSLRFRFPNQKPTTATLLWINQNKVKLTFSDAPPALLLKRLNSSPTSPFKP
jgi:agmatine/peptidylarginine deiminase